MKILSKVREYRPAVLMGVFLILIGLGSVSSKLLIEGMRPNKPLQMSEQAGTDTGRSAKSSGGYGAPMKMTQPPTTEGFKLLKDSASDKLGMGGQAPASAPELATLPPLQDQVIKTGSMTVKIKKGKFNSSYEQVIMLAQANGGYVAGSSSGAVDDRLASGTLTIRVPSRNFELVLVKVRRLGKLTAMDINSQSAATEFVDLQSRLRNWRAQEAVLLNLMNKAANVGDSIMVQQQLSQVQMEIEQITGRLNYLKDQTDFSSLTVTISEPGIGPKPLDPWGVKSAVSQAAHAFVDTINGLIVLVGYLSPLALMAGLAGLIWVGVRGRLSLTGPEH
ncbi:MAG: DUF4349 domain-containing protein [Actinomycetota bacterium]|nr:DUF4349 domain-containing protein [Actinomycetota bacterium]